MNPASTRGPQTPGMLALRSLRMRLLLATVVGLAVAMLLAGWGLSRLFRDHVQQQFQASLGLQLDLLTARFSLDALGNPVVDAEGMSDPRWRQPLSGLYWQVDEIGADGQRSVGRMRSRSLWDTTLQTASDALPDGTVHVHEVSGPQGAVLLLERTIRAAEQVAPDASAPTWRLMVAADLQETDAAVAHFTRMLAVSLLLLLVLLVLAAWAQVGIGLQPLQRLQTSLQRLQNADTPRLEGRFPSEVQPLVDDFNRVLDQNRQVVERARMQAGNLAHALKTPLSVLDQLASQSDAARGNALAIQVREQVQLARRHIDWHLARARVAATQRLPGQRSAVAAAANALVRVMGKVHADRALHFAVQLPAAPADQALWFAGEEQDLHEMLGNLLDNACKWARSQVLVTAQPLDENGSPMLQVSVQDDGPGIDAAHLATVLQRGMRLDESVPGTGLGLAIAQELAELYGGRLLLQSTPGHGLQARLVLPRTDGPATSSA